MTTKSYTIRVAMNAPEITTQQAAQWLDAHLASPGELAADPGAGERSLRLSLDKGKVEQGARAADEAEAVFLRRLIASNAAVPREEKSEREDEARPKPLVLKAALRARAEQVRPLVQLFEAGQSFVIRRAFQVPPTEEAFQAAGFTEEERQQLSVAGAEVLNRRAPRGLIENVDVFGLMTTVLAIESRKIEAVQAVAERHRAAQRTPQERKEELPT